MMSNKFDWVWYINYYPDLISAGIDDQKKAIDHWNQFGKNEDRACSEAGLKERVKDNIVKLEVLENMGLSLIEKLNMLFCKRPLINILTRTSGRENFFGECRDSVMRQNYDNIRHIVGTDDKESLKYLKDINDEDKLEYKRLQKTEKMTFPYNVYLNKLTEKVHQGWIMVLDDDDKLVGKHAIDKLILRIKSEDEMLIWKTWFPDKIIPNRTFGKKITRGDVTGIGFMYHSKHKNKVKWQGVKMGDYEFIEEMSNHLRVRWVNVVATATNYREAYIVNGDRRDKAN